LNEQKEANRKLRQRAYGLLAALAATIVFAGMAGWQWREATTSAKRADEKAEIAESRRLALLSDSVRPRRLDQAMLLALEASAGDTLEARGSLQRCIDDRPEVFRFLDIPEGVVTSVAFGPGGTLAAGCSLRGGGGVVLLDARGERLRAAIEVKEGTVTSVAFSPGGTIAAGYDRAGGGGVVLLDAKGERLRAAIEVKEGTVTSVAFSPGGTIAAGYDRAGG